MNSSQDDPRDQRLALAQAWQPVSQLSSISMLLSWDQDTYLPKDSQSSRAAQLSTLAGLLHEQVCCPELADLVDQILESSADENLRAHARRARRHIDRSTKLPKALARELASAGPSAVSAWAQARSEDQFQTFAPHLVHLLDLKRQEAEAVGGACAYDALLDEFEPEMTVAELDPLFKTLEQSVQLMMAQVREAPAVDESPALGDFPQQKQRDLGQWIATEIGFSFDHGRLDLSAHPFCAGMHPCDVRITWRSDEADFRSGLFGVLHEAGHGLYEQGLEAEAVDLPGTEAVSLGVHESQSRLWENQVGRSKGFWRGLLPHFNETFGTSRTLEQLWPALNCVRPSLIRVEADEVSYLLHIAIRYKIERALLDGDLAVPDLETAWNDAYRDLLGVEPSNLSEGVLQDIHWASGLFGYFPTYALGSMLAAQLFERAGSELGDLDRAFARLEFGPLLAWLRKQIHLQGALQTPRELIRSSTGASLSAEPLLNAARRRIDELYI